MQECDSAPVADLQRENMLPTCEGTQAWQQITKPISNRYSEVTPKMETHCVPVTLGSSIAYERIWLGWSATA